jgi:hypothetical protein
MLLLPLGGNAGALTCVASLTCFVDEVIFGREVTTRLPELAREWKANYNALRGQR